jgi:exodeoxyribonuclease VII large subunit
MPHSTAVSDTTLSVTQLLRRIKNAVEIGVGEVWVEGEVSNLRKQPSGHWYFTLKDEGAQIACAMFSASRREGSKELRDGVKVRVFAEATLYEARGTLQIIVLRAEAVGAGDLQAKFEALKRKLHAEGLFDAGKKKHLPRFPTRVGFVTSDTGAALQDMLNVLGRRASWVIPVLISVRVQGRGAEQEIAAAIREFSRRERAGEGVCDVLIVGRGGGSLEDLWCFNEEIVARAIAECPLPVISAVGHEIDFTIADFAADVRAPTPSAAAELVSPDAEELGRMMETIRARMFQLSMAKLSSMGRQLEFLRRGPFTKDSSRLLRESHTKLDQAEQRLDSAMQRFFAERWQRIEHLQKRLASRHPARWQEAMAEHLAQLTPRLDQAVMKALQMQETMLDHLQTLMRTLSPEAPLQRGYSITFDAAGNLLRNRSDVQAGAILVTRLSDGEIYSKVENTSKLNELNLYPAPSP